MSTGMELIDDNGWFIEGDSQWPGSSLSFNVNKILHYKRSKYQNILVFESKNHGNVLCLDGVLQLNEKFEYCYHEMITHVPLFSHPKPETIL